MLIRKLEEKLTQCINQDIPFGDSYCVVLSKLYKDALDTELVKFECVSEKDDLVDDINVVYSFMGNTFLLVYINTNNTNEITIFKEMK